VHDANNSRLNSENSCYHSAQNVFLLFCFEKLERHVLQYMEYCFVRNFLLVSELIYPIKGREEADYIHEYGDEKDIWV